MKIAEGLHLVASGASGFDLTQALDCNVFLVTDGSEHHLFDAGAGVDVDALVDEIAAGGLDPNGLRTILLTHGHADHSGGAVELLRRFPKIRVVAGTATSAIMADGDERLISLDRARGPVYPMDYRWTAPVIAETVSDRHSITRGGFRFTPVETPGHSDDHVSWLVDGHGLSALVSGDAVFADGKVVLQDIEDCSVSKSLAAIRTLAKLEFEAFLPGHGRFSLRNGKRHVDAAMRFADMGLPPPQL